MTLEGRRYSTTMGSDVQRDGMYLELEDITPRGRGIVAEWFYSDVDGTMTFTAYRRNLPGAVLEWFQSEASRRLPPRADAV